MASSLSRDRALRRDLNSSRQSPDFASRPTTRQGSASRRAPNLLSEGSSRASPQPECFVAQIIGGRRPAVGALPAKGTRRRPTSRTCSSSAWIGSTRQSEPDRCRSRSVRAPPTAPSQTVIKPPRICPEITRPGLRDELAALAAAKAERNDAAEIATPGLLIGLHLPNPSPDSVARFPSAIAAAPLLSRSPSAKAAAIVRNSFDSPFRAMSPPRSRR